MTLHRIVTEPYVPTHEICPVPAWVEHAIDRCLEKDPTKRVQTGRVLVQLLKDERQTARTPAVRRPSRATQQLPPRPPAPKPKKKSVLPKIAIALLTVAVLGSIGFFGRNILTKPSTVAVPQVVGMGEEEAGRILLRSQLKIGAIERRWGHPQSHDLVIDQRPRAGSQLAPGTQVALVIGIGKTAVPELKGLTVAEASALLGRYSLSVGETTRVAGRPEDRDRVLLVYPRPGTELGKDARVNLSIGE
jgi:hypothetical protein